MSFFFQNRASFFVNFSLNLTLLRSLGLEPVSCHKYTSRLYGQKELEFLFNWLHYRET